MINLVCCTNCFSNGSRVTAKAEPLEWHSPCTYCGSADAKNYVHAQDLRDVFVTVVDSYDPCDTLEAQPLEVLLQRDWELFSPNLDPSQRVNLLEAILGNEREFRDKKFIARLPEEALPQGFWTDLCKEIMHGNRWFFTEAETLAKSDWVFSHLLFVGSEDFDQKRDWFRGRTYTGETPWTENDMGAPPQDEATGGRANPPGIPYLYLAGDEHTAAGECRVYPGTKICISRANLPADMIDKLVDLRNPRQRISPFDLENRDQVATMRNMLDLLESFSESLSTPIEPQTSDYAYTPTQYICEFIKSLGYKGIIFRSAMTQDGVNLVYFEPNAANLYKPAAYKVDRVNTDLSPVK